MTYADVHQLCPGDSLISLKGPWDDEYPVVQVSSPKHTPDGSVQRTVYVRVGPKAVQPLTVREGDAFMRSPARYSRH